MVFAEKSKRAMITTCSEESFLWRYGKNLSMRMDEHWKK